MNELNKILDELYKLNNRIDNVLELLRGVEREADRLVVTAGAAYRDENPEVTAERDACGEMSHFVIEDESGWRVGLSGTREEAVFVAYDRSQSTGAQVSISQGGRLVALLAAAPKMQ